MTALCETQEENPHAQEEPQEHVCHRLHEQPGKCQKREQLLTAGGKGDLKL